MVDYCKENTIFARALFDNVAELPRELSFKKGDILTVLAQNYDNNPEWWVCSMQTKIGLAPANRLEAMPVLVANKPKFESQISSNSAYDDFPEQPSKDQYYFNIPKNSDNIAQSDETYSAYQFPKEDVYVNPLDKPSNADGTNEEQSVYQLPSENNLDDTYCNVINNFRADDRDTADSGVSKSTQDDNFAPFFVSGEEAVAKYKDLQTSIISTSNTMVGFANGKWKTEEMLKLNGNSLRQCFLELQNHLNRLLTFAINVHENSLKCTDSNLQKKIAKHLTQLQENKQTVYDSFEKLNKMNWEPGKMATSVRLAVTEGSDALAQVVVAARNIIVNTRALSVTINGNASILFPSRHLEPITSDNNNTELKPNEFDDNKIDIENVLNLFREQIQSQMALVIDTVEDFIRFLSNRNHDSQFIKNVISNSKFVIRSATQLVCIIKNLADTGLKPVPSQKIEIAGNKLCDSLKSMANKTKLLIGETRWSNDQKNQFVRQLEMIKENVMDLKRIFANTL